MAKRPTTPPWTFRSVGSINEVTARWGDRDWLIAKLDSKSLGWHEDSYCAMLENDANARLIAAAPETAAERDRLREVNAELLAALKRIDEWWTRSAPGGPDDNRLCLTTGFNVSLHPELVGIWRQARAAISKAEGKS
jgi:hypothetical protein